MSSELTTYRKNRINELITNYNNTVRQLLTIFNNNILAIQRSNQRIAVKNSKINSLIQNYNATINNLKTNLNKNIAIIQNFVPGALKITNKKYALLIGINYTGTANELYGCIDDANSIKDYLTSKGINNINFITDLTNKPANKSNILTALTNILQQARSGDSIFLFYSGHGSYTLDRNGDETTGSDSCIYPICGNKIEFILDDELKILLANKIPKGCKCFVVLDCCHSGTGLDLKYNMNSPIYGTIVINKTNQKPTNGSIILLSGCNDVQTSADTVNETGLPSGALTNALLDIWNTYGVNIKLKHLLWNIRKLLQERGYTQIPQLSCGNNLNIDSIFDLN